MKEEVGLWIDHKKTVIVTGQGDEIITLNSDIEEEIRFTGETHGKIFGAKNYPTEDHNDRHVAEYLNKYYAKVITYLRAARAIVIMGPGEAKFELEKRLAHEGLTKNVLRIETADKLTDRQIAAKVRQYFNSRRLPSQ